MFHFKNPDTGEEELVSLERFAWGVIYKSGEEFHQFDSGNKFHRLAEIDQKQVRLFCMWKTDGSGERVDIIMPEGARIIHKYKNIKPHYMDKFVRVYMFGYRTGKTEKDFKYHYNFILPDDRIVQSTVENIDLTLFALNRTKESAMTLG